MDAQAVRKMLGKDRAEWEALVAVLDAHLDGPLHDPESPKWTSRDVYAHLARLMETTTNLLEAKLAGHTFPSFEGGDDESENKANAEIQQQYSHMSLAEARGWAQREFERRLQVIASIPDDGWDDQVEELARADGGDHYRGHRGYIRA